MGKNSLDITSLTEEGKSSLDSDWQKRILLVLEDMSTWSKMKYAYAIGADGSKLTHAIGPNAKRVDSGVQSSITFYFLAAIVEEFLTNIQRPAPPQVTIELEREILYIASCGELYIVACFSSGVPKGYMAMKLSKRVSRLHAIWSTERHKLVGLQSKLLNFS